MLKWLGMVLIVLTVCSSGERIQADDASADDAEMEADIVSGTTGQLLSDLNFNEVQDMLDSFLGSGSFSIREALTKMIKGEDAFSEEAVQEFLRGFFFSVFDQEKELFGKLAVLIILAAVFAGLASAFHSDSIGEISFYMVYLLVFMLLMDAFSSMSQSLKETLQWMTEFMRTLAPAYFITVSAASGSASAAVFYEGVLLLVWLIQWLLLTVFLPGTGLYVLLQLVNHLSREEMLGKLAELLHTGISWGLKSLLGLAAGLQVVKSLVAPVMDSLGRGLLGKAASALPGVGNAVNTVTELVLTSAVLVRNCLGVAFLIALVLAGAGPVIHYGVLSLGYRLLAALAEPVSDKRMVECLSTMGEGCAMLLRILFTAEILCMLSFLVIMAGTQG